MGEGDTRKGDIVIGGTLVVAGLAVLLDHAGMLPPAGWMLWPILLSGLGLARFLQSRPGEPRKGLLLMTAAVWLFLGLGGWISLADSWPIVLIALGIIIAFNGGRRHAWHAADQGAAPGCPGQVPGPPRHERSLSTLAVLGVWIAAIVAFQASGLRTFTGTDDGDRVRVVTVMSRTEHVGSGAAFEGADVFNVMGRSELDWRSSAPPPDGSAVVQLFSAMGSVVIRVPPTWSVDTDAMTALGGIRDVRARVADADALSGRPPRLVVRGVVVFGRLTITS